MGSFPKSLKKKTLVLSGFAAALAVISYFFWDQRLAQFFSEPDKVRLWRFCRDITDIGESDKYFILSILIYIFCRWIRPRYSRLRAWALQFFLSLFSIGIFVLFAKILVGRQRPHKTDGSEADIFVPFNNYFQGHEEKPWHWYSMPSGHSQVCFVVVTMLALAFPKFRWIFYTLGFGLALTRVVIREHFLSDVIVGCTIGYLGTLWVGAALELRAQRNKAQLSA